MTKMPAPMSAPMPSAIRCKGPSARFSSFSGSIPPSGPSSTPVWSTCPAISPPMCLMLSAESRAAPLHGQRKTPTGVASEDAGTLKSFQHVRSNVTQGVQIVAAFEHEQRRQLCLCQCFPYPQVVLAPDAEAADRIVLEGVESKRY